MSAQNATTCSMPGTLTAIGVAPVSIWAEHKPHGEPTFTASWGPTDTLDGYAALMGSVLRVLSDVIAQTGSEKKIYIRHGITLRADGPRYIVRVISGVNQMDLMQEHFARRFASQNAPATDGGWLTPFGFVRAEEFALRGAERTRFNLKSLADSRSDVRDLITREAVLHRWPVRFAGKVLDSPGVLF